jgi:hypothetical protein
MSAVYLVVALPVLLVCFALFEKRRAPVVRLAVMAAAVGVAALALAAFWLVPYVIEAEGVSISIGTGWLDAADVLEDALEGEALEGFHPVPWVAGFFGLIFGAVSRKTWPTFLAISTTLLFAVAIVGGEHFADTIQYERLAAYIRGGWLALAAYGFACAFAFLGRRLARFRPALGAAPRWKVRLAEQGLVLLLAATIAAVGWQRYYGRIPVFVPMADGKWEGMRAVGGWLAGKERHSLDRVLIRAEEVCTGGKLRSRRCSKAYNNHLYEAFPVLSGLPKIRFGFQPAEGFANLPMPREVRALRQAIREYRSDPGVLENLGIRWIVSHATFSDRKDLDLAAHIGPLWVYEVVSAPGPARLVGHGTLSIETFEDERIVVDVEHPAPGGVLQFAVAAHPYWRATASGVALPISTRPISPGQKRAVLMSVPAVEGRTELVFERPWYRTASERTSAIAWSLLLAALFLGGVRSLLCRLGRRQRGRNTTGAF